MSNRITMLDETRTARRQAEELLKALREAQATLEQEGGPDLFKKVTGKSSLDSAVAATQRTLEAYDRLLTELGGTPEGGHAGELAPGQRDVAGSISPGGAVAPVVTGRGLRPVTFAAQLAERTA